MTLRSEYDCWHHRIHQADPVHDDSTSPWYQLVRQYLGNLAGFRVLEIACGRGGFTAELAARGAQVVGCDFSASALHAAKEKANTKGIPSVVFSQADAQQLPFPDSCFDLILSCETIEHVPDVSAALREMHRVLKPNGRLLFVEHGLAPEPRVRWWQDHFTPLWKRCSGGCHLNRPIADII